MVGQPVTNPEPIAGVDSARGTKMNSVTIRSSKHAAPLHRRIARASRKALGLGIFVAGITIFAADIGAQANPKPRIDKSSRTFRQGAPSAVTAVAKVAGIR